MRHWLHLCLLMAALPTAKAQDLFHRGRPALLWLTDRDGLTAPGIEGLALDASGLLWISTQGGLMTYDGHTPRPALLRDGTPAGWASRLTFVKDHKLVATQFRGLLLDRGRGLEPLPLEGLPSTGVVQGSLADQTLWATHPRGVFFLEGSRWRPLPHDRPEAIFRELLIEGTGPTRTLWVTTQVGLGCHREGRWTWYTTRDGLPSDRVMALSRDGEALWIGTAKGMAHMEGGKIRAVAGALPHPFVYCLKRLERPGRSPVLFIGTEGGYARWEEGRQEAWSRAQGLPTATVSALEAHLDASGRELLWLGTQAGLVQIQSGGFRRFDQELPVADPNTWAIHQTGPRGALWFAATGLARWEQGRWTRFGAAQGLPEDTFFALASSGDGQTLWVGSKGHGLLTHKMGRFEAIPGCPDTYVYTLHVTQTPRGADQLWVGTRRGVSLWSDGTWRTWTEAEGMPQGQVTGLTSTRDSEGRPTIWAAIRTRGLGFLAPGAQAWRWFTPAESHARPTSLKLVQESRGPALWMGTVGGGIHRFHLDLPPAGQPLERLPVLGEDRLPGLGLDTTFSIQQGADGRIFACTRQGVAVLRQQGEGRFEGIRLTVDEGLPSNECQHMSSLMDQQGRLWVGTVLGPAALDPDTLMGDRTPKPLQWVSIQQGNHPPVPLGNATLKLPWRRERIVVQYRQISYLRGRDSLYRTQIHGVEAAPTPWTALDHRELLSLPPGRHRLEVWAQDHAGNLSTPLYLELLVEAPPWLRPWAFLLYVGAMAAAAHALYRWRVHALKRSNELLSVQVARATQDIQIKAQRLEKLNEEKNVILGIAAHDLRSPLGSIHLLAEFLLEEELPPEARTQAAHIKKLASDSAVFVQNLLDTTRIEAGRLDLNLQPLQVSALLEEVLRDHRHRAESKGLELRMETSGVLLPPLVADPAHLREVLDNLVSNAIKFSPVPPPPRHVLLRALPGRLEVVDQGPGFQPEDIAKLFQRFQRLSARPTGGEPSTGLGLAIVRDLVEAMGGRIALDSRPGEGARFIIELPTPEGPLG